MKKVASYRVGRKRNDRRTRNPVFLDDPGVAIGRIEGNPFQECEA